MDDALWHRLVQHLFVPLLQSLGFGYLLIRRMAVEDVVISFTGRAGPDVSSSIPGVVRQNQDMWALTTDSRTLSSLRPGGATTDLAAIPRPNISIFSLILQNPALYMEHLHVKGAHFTVYIKNKTWHKPSTAISQLTSGRKMESRYFSSEISRQSSSTLSSNILKTDVLKDRIHFSIVNPLSFENWFEKVSELHLGINRHCQAMVLGTQSRVLLR